LPDLPFVNAAQLKRWLARQGCAFETKRSGSGHLIVRRGDRRSELPMHGGSKQLGKGLIAKIKKDLGLQ
jgi:mRNA interferase HicA